MLTVFLLLCSLVGLVLIIQDDIAFQKHYDEENHLYLQGKPGFNEVQFKAENGKTYHGMLHKPVVRNDDDIDKSAVEQNGKSPLLIYFCGNGQTSYSYMRKNEESDFWSNYSNYQVLCLDYEGYGLTAGSPHYLNIYEEALAVYDYAKSLPDVDERNIVVMGYSLGTGPSVYLAANRPVAGLVLLAPYATGADIYNAMLPIFVGPAVGLVKQKFPSLDYAPQVTCDTLVIASHDDEAVPFLSSKRLVSSFKTSVELVELSGVNHNKIYSVDKTKRSLLDFLEQIAVK